VANAPIAAASASAPHQTKPSNQAILIAAIAPGTAHISVAALYVLGHPVEKIRSQTPHEHAFRNEYLAEWSHPNLRQRLRGSTASHAMPRFYFHIRDHEQLVVDEDGPKGTASDTWQSK
jgi:hypothetical protein